MPLVPILDVVAAVIERDDTLLACRRRAGKASAGRWEFPGGKIEQGETAEEALVREIREELSVGIRVTGHLTTDVTGGIRLSCLRAELVDAVPAASTDHDALRWVRRAQLGELEWADADLPAVRMLQAGQERTNG
jgi:8-oxo-dGTP diphosphatase